MASPTRTSSFLAVVLGLCGLVLFVALRSESQPPANLAEPLPAVAQPDIEPEPEVELAKPRGAQETESAPPSPLSPFTLDVKLDLQWASPVGGDRIRAWGSGRTASLEGRFANAFGAGFEAAVEIVGGPNAGRRALSDEDGHFVMGELYPGLAIVEVSGAGIPGSRREVLLGRDRASLLNIGYGRLAVVYGKVTDAADNAIDQARVLFDGQETWTDEEGVFRYSGVAGGNVLVEIEKAGFASYREKLSVASGTTIEIGRLRYILREEAALTLLAKSNSSAPIDVYLTPSRPSPQRAYPWYRLHPIRLEPGVRRRISALPDVPVHVRAFQQGAHCDPQLVTLSRGNDRAVALVFEPAPKLAGRLLHAGRPVAGADVRIEAPDRGRAILAYFREPSSLLSTEVLPPLPPAYQALVSGSDGTFDFAVWPENTPAYYLEARAAGPNGQILWGGRVVQVPNADVELELEPLDAGSGRVELLTWRDLALRVNVQVSGREPGEPQVFEPAERIAIDGLRPGTWRLVVSWQGGTIIELPGVVVDGEEPAGVELELPERVATM